jgi:hypothetical protein
MIPQERGLEGINVISYSIYPFCLREGINYMSFLGEARRFLIPHEILKPPLDCWGGWLIARSLLHPFMRSFTCSLIHSFILTYHSLIHPHLRLGLGKGNKLPRLATFLLVVVVAGVIQP